MDSDIADIINDLKYYKILIYNVIDLIVNRQEKVFFYLMNKCINAFYFNFFDDGHFFAGPSLHYPLMVRNYDTSLSGNSCAAV